MPETWPLAILAIVALLLFALIAWALRETGIDRRPW